MLFYKLYYGAANKLRQKAPSNYREPPWCLGLYLQVAPGKKRRHQCLWRYGSSCTSKSTSRTVIICKVDRTYYLGCRIEIFLHLYCVRERSNNIKYFVWIPEYKYGYISSSSVTSLHNVHCKGYKYTLLYILYIFIISLYLTITVVV